MTPVRRVNGRVEDVRIMHGGDAKRWRPKLIEKIVITDEAVRIISAKIEKYQSETN
jgi:hypothetical protein